MLLKNKEFSNYIMYTDESNSEVTSNDSINNSEGGSSKSDFTGKYLVTVVLGRILILLLYLRTTFAMLILFYF